MTMPPSCKIYVRHRRDRRLYEAYLRHLTQPKWRPCTSTRRDADVPLATPSFGSAIAWIRKNRHVINGVVLLLRLYPDIIRDDSLNSFWEFLTPYLALCALHSAARTGSVSDIPPACHSGTSTPTFVEISFPVRPLSKMNISRSYCTNSTRIARSANVVHQSKCESKRRNEVINLSTLPKCSSSSNLSENKSRPRLLISSTCTTPIPRSDDHVSRLAPPTLPLSPLATYIPRPEARPITPPRPATPETNLTLPEVKPNKTNNNNNNDDIISETLKTKCTDRKPDNPSAAAAERCLDDKRPPSASDTIRKPATNRPDGNEPGAEAFDVGGYIPTRYLLTKRNSVNHIRLVRWPPRAVDDDLTSYVAVGSGACLSEGDDESELSFPLNNENADIDLWSETPIEGIDGELE